MRIIPSGALHPGGMETHSTGLKVAYKGLWVNDAIIPSSKYYLDGTDQWWAHHHRMMVPTAGPVSPHDYSSGWRPRPTFVSYGVGLVSRAPDFDPGPMVCGHGLHVCAHPKDIHSFCGPLTYDANAVFLRVLVPASLIVQGKSQWAADQRKWRAPWCLPIARSRVGGSGLEFYDDLPTSEIKRILADAGLGPEDGCPKRALPRSKT